MNNNEEKNKGISGQSWFSGKILITHLGSFTTLNTKQLTSNVISKHVPDEWDKESTRLLHI